MSMNWVQRKIYLYNVTFGLYMLDAWERYLFNSEQSKQTPL
ncbi:putative small subunit of serine palmitoyltransferase [Helianthus annuus]|nr:putative small subunit of serine palmitoyltransferase [Helianthus annuus]